MKRALLLAALIGCSGGPPPSAPATPVAEPTPPIPTREPETPAPTPTPTSRPAPASREDTDAVAGSVGALGADLYRELARQPGNLAISPASIATALAMTAGGARGETAVEMHRVLHVEGDPETRIAQLGRAMSALGTPREAYEIAVANRLFGERSAPFEQAFLDSTRARFGAPLEPVDFRSAAEAARTSINAWVAEQTRDRIRDLLPPRSLDTDTRLVLVNAIYFKGRWETEFDPQRTSDQPFHVAPTSTASVATMQRRGRYGYLEANGAHLLEIPYRGGELSMLVVLPDDPAALDAWAADAAHFVRPGALPTREVDVTLPRFRIDPPTSTALKETLRTLGMPLAFTAGADFTGIASPPDAGDRLRISEVFHKCFVEVNEEGTEAAAATAVVMARGGGRPPPVTEFHADRPFLFVVRDVASGLPLFLGRVSDPR